MSQVYHIFWLCDNTIYYISIVKKCDISKGLDFGNVIQCQNVILQRIFVISHNVKMWYYKNHCDFSSMI